MANTSIGPRRLRSRLPLAAAVGVAVLSGSFARAEVVKQSETGFRIEQAIVVAASPKDAWAMLIAPAAWWSPAHTYSGDARNLRLKAKVGGCWCETWDGNAVRHLAVISVMPGSSLVMEGGLGPLQAMGVNGVMAFTVAPEGDGARISLTYTVGGFFDPSAEAIAPAVDGVLGEQMGNLAEKLGGG